MNDLSLVSSHQDSTTSFKSGKLIHEVEEKHSFEWLACKFRDRVYLGNEILIFELMLSVPLDLSEESFRKRQVAKHIVHKLFDLFLVVIDDWSPSYHRCIINVNLIGFGNMREDWSWVWLHV